MHCKKRKNAPDTGSLYTKEIKAEEIPQECIYEIGAPQTLRAALGTTLNYLNKKTKGAFIGAAADLLGSEGVSARVVSLPCWEAFFAQDDAYRTSVLGEGLPIVSVEALTTFGWERITGADGLESAIAQQITQKDPHIRLIINDKDFLPFNVG